VAQVARWLAIPEWAQVGFSLSGWPAVAAAYAALWVAMEAALGSATRRAAGRVRPAGWLALAAAAIVVLVVSVPVGTAPGAGDLDRGLRIVVLDVGQGDAILLRPPGGGPVLVDGGPPGDDVEAELREEGVSGLAAAVVTHDQSDHVAGIERLLYDGFPIDRLLYAEPGADFLRAARAARVPALQVAEGSGIDSAGLHLDVLWPPGTLLGAEGRDSNQTGLILLARWRSFSMLLAADAEAEAVPIDPGPIDVLKVAHHGSADAGLDTLLDRSVPRLAVISVGADNPYGHPAPEALATLAERGTPVLRTDEDGDVTIDVTSSGWSARTG
jgi:competence protein ComEC